MSMSRIELSSVRLSKNSIVDGSVVMSRVHAPRQIVLQNVMRQRGTWKKTETYPFQ